jgi:hypothetical protein
MSPGIDKRSAVHMQKDLREGSGVCTQMINEDVYHAVARGE